MLNLINYFNNTFHGQLLFEIKYLIMQYIKVMARILNLIN